MKNGLYRNKVGAELRVLWPVIAVGEFLTLGDTYEAKTVESPDSVFPPTAYIVTEKSLVDAGYEIVSEVVSS